MSRNLLIFALLLIVLVTIAFFAFGSDSRFFKKTIAINNHTVTVEIADSPAEQIKGLSDRDSLASNNGMLFVFGKSDTYPFWMKDMRIPIDIIFLDNNRVVTIYENVPAFSGEGEKKVPNLTLYSPKSPANRVLELNAGKTKEFGLKEGDTITINL